MSEVPKKLRIGVFGGERGIVMIRALLHHPKAQLVAVCDRYRPLLDRASAEAEKLGVKIALYPDFDSFIQHEMDAVILANYATEHAPFAMRCLRAGLHVLSEVLPCETMAQAVQLIETVEETGLVYAYAENYCYRDATFEMWRRYRQTDIGEIQYAEGSYIHDCTSCWAGITYGQRDHWRNHMYPTFYCTHSLGPILASTGKRPVQVVGFENPPIPEFYDLGHVGGHASGVEMVTLEGGAIVRSIHGPLRCEPAEVSYRLYGSRGCIKAADDFWIYRESEPGNGRAEQYAPRKFVAVDLTSGSGIESHGGSDFYPTHCFIERILGGKDGRWSLDVYAAVDMGICGILAYRSILNGNVPVRVPNLRVREERDAYRNDRACTTPDVAGDQVVPCSSYGERAIPDEVYQAIREKWGG